MSKITAEQINTVTNAAIEQVPGDREDKDVCNGRLTLLMLSLCSVAHAYGIPCEALMHHLPGLYDDAVKALEQPGA